MDVVLRSASLLVISLRQRMTLVSHRILATCCSLYYQTIPATTTTSANRLHQLQLTQKTTHLNNKLFISRSLFKNIYLATYLFILLFDYPTITDLFYNHCVRHMAILPVFLFTCVHRLYQCILLIVAIVNFFLRQIYDMI